MWLHIKNLFFPRLIYYFLVSWFGWLMLAAVIHAEDLNINITSPITEIENIGESLDNERTREKALRAKANDLSREIIMISNKVRGLRDLLKVKEEKIDLIKAELKKLEITNNVGEGAALLREDSLQSSIALLLFTEHRAKTLSITFAVRSKESLLRSAALATLVERLKKQRDKNLLDIAVLDELHARQIRETESLLESKKVLDDQRRELEFLLHRKSSLQAIIFSEHRKSDERLARLAAKAGDLRQLMEVLESPEKETLSDTSEETIGRESGSSSTLNRDRTISLPTVHSYLNLGRVLTGFGGVLENGLDSPGLIIATRPDTDVICLRDGKVVFSDKFRTYGQLLIIEHGQGYHTLLSGFARIYGEVGDWVTAGEPVGVMGGLESKGLVLYVEMRRQGTPMNPTGWLDLIDREVRG